MQNKIDLTQGNIAIQLTRVSLPIMFTMFVQMAYTLTDMFWIGKLGSGAVAAIGSAGFYTWLGMAVAFLAKTGIEVTVAQSAGRNDTNGLRDFVCNGLILTVSIAICYSLFIFFSAEQLIIFFNLGHDVNSFDPTANATIYLRILSVGMIFTFCNLSFTAIYNGLGRSKLPFYLNSIGLCINIILDPLIIYGIGPFPRLEVPGAAVATVFSHGVVTALFLYHLRKHFDFFSNIKNFLHISSKHLKQLIRIGLPPSIQGVIFACIGIVLARIISQWGPVAIAVQRIGSQIEAISWMTANGFSIALSSFVGQNYGAGKIRRIWTGFKTAIAIMTGLGLFTTFLLLCFPEFLFTIFISEVETVRAGVVYLTIISFSQLFMCLEMTTAGAWNGMGRSIPPSIISITFNLLRIPAAIVLSGMLGISGVWWSISGSSIVKGFLLVLWFVIFYRFYMKNNSEEINAI
jgi:putative MATE family efflux protein